MRKALGLLPVVLLAIGGCATGERQARYDEAMSLTVAELRQGDLDSARSSVQIARSNARGDEDHQRVEDLTVLIDGAEAYCNGDRIQAGDAWSRAESPVIRRAISSHQSDLGVVIRSDDKGGAR